MTPQQVREEWAKGKVPGDSIADMAAKAENSKPASKARETLSWDEIRRPLQSEVDAAMHSVMRNFKGGALGQAPGEVEKTINRLLVITAVPGRGVIMSLDIIAGALRR
jgi:hypothetical protein